VQLENIKVVQEHPVVTHVVLEHIQLVVNQVVPIVQQVNIMIYKLHHHVNHVQLVNLVQQLLQFQLMYVIHVV
jgi:hypothetical protein